MKKIYLMTIKLLHVHFIAIKIIDYTFTILQLSNAISNSQGKQNSSKHQ